jgi:ABC-2 type transport system ATP-binding protein
LIQEFAIHTQGLSRSFGTIRAVEDLDLNVPSGIVFGFLGPNGSGKTTTIRLLLGLLSPSSGRAVVMGYDSSTQADQIRLFSGALLEHNGLYERLSAWDNLDLYARIYHLDSSQRQPRVEELLTHFNLYDRRHEIVKGWSRGMKQKLAVARAMLHRPALLFLDEPTAGLDPVAAAALRDDLAALTEREKTTVFLTTHNLNEAESLCQQIGVLRRGRLVAQATPEDLRQQLNHTHLQIEVRSRLPTDLLDQLQRMNFLQEPKLRNSTLTGRLPAEARAAPLVRFLVEQGFEVEEVRKEKASLEEVFLTLVSEADHEA